MKTGQLKIGDTVIIKKGSCALRAETGSVGEVVEVKQVPGSKLLPGSETETYKVDLLSVLCDGKTLLFGPIDDPLQKAVPVCTVAERDQIAAQSAAQSTRATRWLQHALRYRREWSKARRELVTMSEQLSSKDIEVQQMRAANAFAREDREQADELVQLTRELQESTEKAASVTEEMYARLEQSNTTLRSEILNLHRKQEEQERDFDTQLQRARKPAIDASIYLRGKGYDGDLLPMIEALERDLEVYRNAYNGMVRANSESGKIIELEFGNRTATAPAS